MHTNVSLDQRLTRSPDGLVGGVCEGLGKHFGVNPNTLRIIWLVAVLGFGTGLLFYLILWWLMPRADTAPLEPSVWVRRQDGTAHAPLRRTAVDRKFLGVCGGLARRWDFDPTLVRLGALSLFTLSGGLAIFAYFAAAMIMRGPENGLISHPVEL